MKSKPISGSFATTTDQTIHTENARSRQAIEIQRLRVAIRRPVACPELRILGFQSDSTRAGACTPGMWISCISGSSGNSSSGVAPAARSIARIERCIQVSATPTSMKRKAKQEV